MTLKISDALVSLWATVDASMPRLRDVQSAHKALLKAIDAGQADRASTLARRHLEHSQRYSLDESSDEIVKATSLRNDFRQLTG